MTNKEIAGSFDLLAKVMELHSENPFKIRSYQNAYLNLRKLDKPLGSIPLEELKDIQGIGDAIADKIQSLVNTGSMPTLEKYLAKTPPGVIDMLRIHGLGPKKVAILWKEHGFTSPGELLYACNENRLIELKGFGLKTQETIVQGIDFLQSSAGKFLHTKIESHGTDIINKIKNKYPHSENEMTGNWRLGDLEIRTLEILTTCNPEELKSIFSEEDMAWKNKSAEHQSHATWKEFLPTVFYHADQKDWVKNLLLTTGPENWVSKFDLDGEWTSEQDFFEKNKLPYLPPELRDIDFIEVKSQPFISSLVSLKDIKGIIHSHSTYSDGIHSLKEMGDTAKELGYDYFVITDHSQAAVYAKGLKPDRLEEQWSEIDSLNKKYKAFRIFKGIECDILASGDLDYDEAILSNFEVVIASIHSAFQMDIDKATKRLIKAIENPATNIIGHPSGRLILSREGYPLDYSKIIDACKVNQVAIELNANPQRLDIDFRFIRECVKNEVFIAINPDAHNRSAIKDIRYGVQAARKGLLPKELCLNALSLEGFQKFCNKR